MWMSFLKASRNSGHEPSALKFSLVRATAAYSHPPRPATHPGSGPSAHRGWSFCSLSHPRGPCRTQQIGVNTMQRQNVLLCSRGRPFQSLPSGKQFRATPPKLSRCLKMQAEVSRTHKGLLRSTCSLLLVLVHQLLPRLSPAQVGLGIGRRHPAPSPAQQGHFYVHNRGGCGSSASRKHPQHPAAKNSCILLSLI